MNNRRGDRRGISRPEILFMLSILLGVLSIAVPALVDITQRSRSQLAYRDLRILVSASLAFNREYRLWPVAEVSSQGDLRYGWRRSNAEVMQILGGRETGGDESSVVNASGIDFLAQASDGIGTLSFNDQGEVVDPWGHPYEILYDANYDSICSIDDAVNGSVIGEGVVVWSGGPDGKVDTPDDLRSWIR